MRLTRLELYGFKSFADRTAIDLNDGLTAIIGPNGCGKSNIMDAVKWALGEQRATVLRGDEMMDVVFKGNGTRRPRNFAEVSLTFDNTDGVLPVEYQEVVITRRLFRSGESEYLINRDKCRLKDVRNLLLDTGLGTSAYSIMEQGRIDAILSANPSDRRQIFEEAAGVSRYRAQRRESESKLARTEQNLLRLGDIVEELEKRLRSLKNQAGRARSYVSAQERLAELKSLFYVHRWEELDGELASLTELGKVREREQEASRQKLTGVRQELDAIQGQVAGAREAVDEAAEAFRKATSESEALSGREESLQDRREDLTKRKAESDVRISELRQVLSDREGEGAHLREKQNALEESRASGAEEVFVLERSLAEGEERFQEWRGKEEKRRAETLDHQEVLTEVREQLTEMKSRQAGIKASFESIRGRAEALEQELEKSASLEGSLFAGARHLAVNLEQAHRQVEDQRQQKDSLAGKVDGRDDQLARLREELARVDSRRAALEEMITLREGLSPGPRAVLDSGLQGVEGLVVDLFTVSGGLARAVEAALGSKGEAVVMRSRRDALAAAQFVEEKEAGQVLLLSQDTLRKRTRSAEGSRLFKHLDVKGDTAVVEALLGHVCLVDDREALLACEPDGVTVWVTRSGEVLDEGGVLRVGQPGVEGGLLTRRAECEDLQRQTSEIEKRLESLAEERKREMETLVAREGDLDKALARVQKIEAERERTQERERQAAERKVALEQDLAGHHEELSGFDRERESLAGQLKEMSGRESALLETVERDREEEVAATVRREQFEMDVSGRSEKLATARLELSRRDERREALIAEIRQVDRAITDRKGDLESTVEERSQLVERDGEIGKELEQLVERGRALAEHRDQMAGQLGTVKEKGESLQGHLEGARKRLELTEEASEKAGVVLNEHRMSEQEVRIRREGLREKVLEELEVDLAEEKPALEEAAQEEGETDWKRVEEEIEQLRQKMSRMGNVNLTAIDELDEVEERHTFLANQQNDLLGARKTLQETIERLNKESKEKFLETFVEVREHFRSIFRKLFQGGKADIHLQDAENILETGVDIVAAPPGKDARSISLLSGGERTLTAVGLLFALFKTRPSPVCLLDEVDAALDETNIDRFCRVLEDFLSQSQFVVVTHARRTMSYANALYGITMQEHGISRAIGLTLDQTDSFGEGGDRVGKRKDAAAGQRRTEPSPSSESAPASRGRDVVEGGRLGAGDEAETTGVEET
ncbi:MAG: chromosome segregation protein SMC [Planctomycetota bacterium]|nr:chromosome segregation protein SMC [Planctomycetota bacterium]